MGRLIMVLALVAAVGLTAVGCKREPAPPPEEPTTITPLVPRELPVPPTEPAEAPAIEEAPMEEAPAVEEEPVTEPVAAPAVEEPMITEPPEGPIPK
jgi:hypothetical protein